MRALLLPRLVVEFSPHHLYLSQDQLKPTLVDSCIGGWDLVRVLAKVNKAEVQVPMVLLHVHRHSSIEGAKRDRLPC